VLDFDINPGVENRVTAASRAVGGIVPDFNHGASGTGHNHRVGGHGEVNLVAGVVAVAIALGDRVLLT
jgi:hypothetical protein